MRTRLTEVLGIERPVMLAGMGGSRTPSCAPRFRGGWLGCLGASTMRAEQMDAEMRRGQVPDRAPRSGSAHRDARRHGRPGVAGSSTGVRRSSSPASVFRRDVVELCHDHEVKVVNMCGKVSPRPASGRGDAGCDLVVAQGTEAGGHTGKVATLPLVPQIVDAVGSQVPVVAAGGIFDGRGLAATLAARSRRGLGRHPLHRDTRSTLCRGTRIRWSPPPRTARRSAVLTAARP